MTAQTATLPHAPARAWDVDTVFYLLVILGTALVLAVQTWGLAALVVTAVALVPVIFATLIWITLP